MPGVAALALLPEKFTPSTGFDVIALWRSAYTKHSAERRPVVLERGGRHPFRHQRRQRTARSRAGVIDAIAFPPNSGSAYTARRRVVSVDCVGFQLAGGNPNLLCRNQARA